MEMLTVQDAFCACWTGRGVCVAQKKSLDCGPKGTLTSCKETSYPQEDSTARQVLDGDPVSNSCGRLNSGAARRVSKCHLVLAVLDNSTRQGMLSARHSQASCAGDVSLTPCCAEKKKKETYLTL